MSHSGLIAIASSSAQITPLLVNRLSNKLAPNVPNNMLRNPPFVFSALFLIALLPLFINKPDSSREEI